MKKIRSYLMLLLIFLMGICIKESAISSSTESTLMDHEIQDFSTSLLLSSNSSNNSDCFSAMLNGYQFLDVSTEAKLSDLFKDISYISESARENASGRTNNYLPQILKNLKSPATVSFYSGEEQACCSNAHTSNFRYSGKDYYVYHLHHIII